MDPSKLLQVERKLQQKSDKLLIIYDKNTVKIEDVNVQFHEN